MAGVLEGIRVLDFGRYIAGPYCATLLAEHRAGRRNHARKLWPILIAELWAEKWKVEI